MWFLQVEWTLKHAGITTTVEKFEIIGTALDPIYTQEVRGLLCNPPPEPEDPFSKLKEALRECLELSIQDRTRQLLERDEIGDRTPWQFLHPITRAGIAAQQGSTKLEDLAKIGDNIKYSVGPWRPAGGTSPMNNSESQLAEEFARLRLQIHGLQAKVDEVAEHQRASFRNRSSSRSSSRGRSSSRSSSRDRSRTHGFELYDDRGAVTIKAQARMRETSRAVTNGGKWQPSYHVPPVRQRPEQRPGIPGGYRSGFVRVSSAIGEGTSKKNELRSDCGERDYHSDVWL
ncbi:hypothetical protein GWI33_017795 [Rhynchophorus ferrugineus]|uniref:DUF7041 domain-containing protein n=1 Tax=Rhynchophorus ferrugineus TaxID=354439 RepID=A0A834I1C2_RHYFE|nr:hypothetical protein GWI33_017795 [Rhynchophorus ferrugineus]